MSERNETIQADVRRVCSMIGISLPTTSRTEKLIVKLIGVVNTAIKGVSDRLDRQNQMIVRSSAAANQAWNATNVLARALGDRLIERGLFEDRDDLNRACERAAEELRNEAAESNLNDPDDPIGRAVRAALGTPQARSSVASALVERALTREEDRDEKEDHETS